MIGTYEDAALALAGKVEPFSTAGTTRVVYLINGVIYKVNNWMLGAGFDVNKSEAENLSFWSDNPNVPNNVKFPDFHLFDVTGANVIAMEYIKGQAMADCYCWEGEAHGPDCAPDEVIAAVSGILDDTGGMNIIVNDEGIYIIDLG